MKRKSLEGRKVHGKVRSVYFEVRKEEEEQERDGFVAVSWELNKAKVSCVSSMSGEREKGTQETDTSNLTLNDIHTSLVTHYGRLNVPLNFGGGSEAYIIPLHSYTIILHDNSLSTTFTQV